MSEGCQSNQCVWSDHPEQVTTLWIECQTTIVCDTLECQAPWSMSAVGQATCWTSKPWSSVMYIIKSRITLHQTDGWHRIWKSRGECYVAVNMAPNHGAGGVGVTDWAVTPMDGKKTDVEFYSGTFMGQSYLQGIIQPTIIIPQWCQYAPYLMLMDDNAPPFVLMWLNLQEVDVTWPDHYIASLRPVEVLHLCPLRHHHVTPKKSKLLLLQNGVPKQYSTSSEEYEPEIVGCHQCTWWEYFVLCANYKVWGLCPELDTGYAIKFKWNVFLVTKNNATHKISKYPSLILSSVCFMYDWVIFIKYTNTTGKGDCDVWVMSLRKTVGAFEANCVKKQQIIIFTLHTQMLFTSIRSTLFSHIQISYPCIHWYIPMTAGNILNSILSVLVSSHLQASLTHPN